MFKRLLALLFPRATFLLSPATAFLFACVTALVVLSATASATTPITGKIQNLGQGTVSAGTFVRFYLRGCSGNQPRVNGIGIIAPTLGNVYYFDFVPDSTGAILGTLYSTRDSSGVGPGDIECGGSLTAVWYGMQPYVNGKAGPETAIHAKSGVPLDISTVIPITANPVVTAAVGMTALSLPGSISGFTLLQAEPVASGILTLPAATDTLVGLNTTDILTNKTLSFAQLSGTTINNTMLSSSLGSVTNPIYSFAQEPTTGFYSPSLNQITAAVGGVNGPTFSQSGITFGTDGEFINFGLARDTSLSRLSPGVLAVGNGNLGDTSGTVTAGVMATTNSFGGVYRFTDTSGGVDTKNWDIFASKSRMEFRALNDALNSANSVMQIERGTGLAVSAVNLNSVPLTFGTSFTGGDTGLSRTAAGVVAIGNGTQGDASGTLKATAIQQGPSSFNLLDANGVSHLLISNISPFANTFISGNGSGKVVFGNNLTTIPDSGNNLQFAAVAGSPDTSVSRSAAGTIAIGNGTQGDKSGIVAAAKLTDDGAGNFYLVQNTAQAFNTYSGGAYTWSSSGLANGPKDTGLSRPAAGTVAVGNGTPGDASGTLSAAVHLIGGGPQLTQDTGRYGALGARVQTTSANNASALTVMPNGTSNTSSLRLYNASNAANTGAAELSIVGTTASLASESFGTGSAPTLFDVSSFANLKAATVNATTGYQVNGAAPSGNVLRGNGTNFVAAQVAAGDLSNGTTGSGAVVLQVTPTLNTPTLQSPLITGTAAGNGTIPPTMLNSTTGTGAAVLATSPTLTTPNIGAATGTSLTSTGADLTLAETGDQLATAKLHVRNRTGAGGVVLENPGSSLGDFAVQASAAITNIAIDGANNLTVTAAFASVASTLPSVGQTVTLTGLTNATFLNNQVVTIATISATQFTASFTHAAYTSAPDTGSAIAQINLRAEFRNDQVTAGNSSGEFQVLDPTNPTNHWLAVGKSINTFAGTVKAPVVNATTGFQVNGTALAAANLSNGTTGSGAVVLAAGPALTTPNLGAATANTVTFPLQSAPANPPTNSITLYGDINSQQITCRNSSGTSCFSATAAAPFVSSTANPAQTGVLRAASTDTAVAFRNNANTADIAGLAKDTSDLVQVGGAPGMKSNSITATGAATLPTSCGGGAVFFNDNGSPNSADICFGDGTGWFLNFTKRTGSTSTSVASIKDTGIINATGGYQVNGSALSAANLSNGTTGSGAVVLQNSPTINSPTLASPTITGTASGNATLPQGMITPGTNGQCLTTSGGAATWGSCGPTAPISNTTAVTVNNGTNTLQTMQSVTFSAGVFNTVGKMLTIDGAGTFSVANGTIDTMGMTIGGQNLAFASVSGVNSGSFLPHFVCTVTGAGSSGTATCLVHNGATGGTLNFSGINWTSAITISTTITFTTSTTSDSGTSNVLTVIPNN